MKKLLIAIALATTLLAQTGKVYIPTADETDEARRSYAMVTNAEASLKTAQAQWAAFKAHVKKAHGITDKEATIEFNSEFTTFERSLGYPYGFVTCCTSTCGCAYTTHVVGTN